MAKKTVISIDCGGTNLRVAAMDEEMNILAVNRVPTVRDNPEKLYETMRDLVWSVSDIAKVPVNAIGMSICGIVVNNHVGKCGNLGLEKGYDFLSRFRRDFPNAVFSFGNDANCSALVESMLGATKGLRDSAFVTISSGIGIGLIHKGEMVDLPMEGGRVMINFRGNYYEAEYLLSGNGIVRLAKMMGLEVASGREFFDLVRKKDTQAMLVYNQWIGMLGIYFGNLQLLFDTEKIALSGGVMKSKDVFMDDLTKVSNAAVASWNLRPIVFVESEFSQDVGLAGGACLALKALR